MSDRILTGADPQNQNLSVLTAEQLAAREKEEAEKARALKEANKAFDRAAVQRRRPRRTPPGLGGLLLSILGALGCEVHAVPSDAAVADLAVPDLATAPDLRSARGHSDCDDLPESECLACEDPKKDCRPAAPPTCLACSWTETMNCLPSLCRQFRYDIKCCPLVATAGGLL